MTADDRNGHPDTFTGSTCKLSGLKAGSCLLRTRYIPYTMNKKTAESIGKNHKPEKKSPSPQSGNYNYY